MRFFKLIAVISVVFGLYLAESALAAEKYGPFLLDREPMVRIGLLRNSSAVSITTTDESLVSSIYSGQMNRLGTTRIRIGSKMYRPPSYEVFRLEIVGFTSRGEANEARQRLDSMGFDAIVLNGKEAGTFRLKLERESEIRSEADELAKKFEAEFNNQVVVLADQYSAPSDDAVALTRQITANPKSKVRSLQKMTRDDASAVEPGRVRTISSSRSMRRKNRNVRISSSLREVVINGSTPQSKFSSLRPVTIGTSSGRGIIRLNGRRYRGNMEVFMNSKGRITVVNVVPMEDYLLGVVPAELSLPQLEAQKAQAVAARTYAVANKDGYGDEGFDMLPTVWSQVYKGVAIESKMGSRAVRETRGIVATYRGKPINALYTSTCGGRTEHSGNIFEFDEPYLRGVNCALDGDKHFTSFLVKTSREPALIRNEANYEFVRLASKLAVNNFLMITPRFDDDYFEDPPTDTEVRSWVNQVAVKLKKPFPVHPEEPAKPLNLARTLYQLLYSPQAESNADTLLSESDINYQLSFLDSSEVPKKDRAMLAEMLRDGWFSIYSDLTLKPNKAYSRGKILKLFEKIYEKKKWPLSFESGTAKPTEDGKLILRAGRGEKEIAINENVFLFRKFGNEYYQVKETALIGGERVRYKLNGAGEAVYLEVEPASKTTVAERMSPFTVWRTRLSASATRARLSRYVRGLGTLIDVKVKSKGFSRRATELEIITTNGTHTVKGGRIRSALRLREQLFVMNKRYGANGRVASISFVGRGWGHGVGMCQYGAYGFAKMGLPFNRILKHYYSGVELTKAYG